jgi:hypothetical protein
MVPMIADPNMLALMLSALGCLLIVAFTFIFPEKFDRMLDKIGKALNNLTDND